MPFQINGNCPLHNVVSSVVVSNGKLVTVIILMESQPPVVLGTVSVNDPAVLNTLPSKV